MLIGRDTERRAVDSLVAGARVGRSGVLVLTGEAGIGKTVLLGYAAAAAEGMQVHRLVGTELEQDLGFGGLSQLVGASAQDLEGLPEPQARALAVALDLRPGPSPDRFAVGAATLGLLTRRAEEGPVAVLVDDAHLLDHLSAAALAFAARRLVADPILVVAAVRSGEPTPLLQAGLPVLELRGLDVPAATQLLAAGDSPGAGSAGVVTDVPGLVRATGGNPLALLELRAYPERLSAAGPDGPLPVTAAVTRAFQARTERLSAAARTALLVAAAGGTDRRLVTRACRSLGVDPVHLVEAADVGLVTTQGATVTFRHPLVRAAVYQAARPADRRAAHAALAAATSGADPDHRAWHLAAAVPDTDAVAADALEEVADRARSRAAYDVVASALSRAGWLSPEEQDRSRRLVSAAEAAWVAGQADRARAILDEVDADGTPDLLARAGRLRGTLAALTGSLPEAIEVLSSTAERVRDTRPELAVELWADGVKAGFFRADTAFLRRAVTALDALLPLVRSSRIAVVGELASGMARTLTGQAGSEQIRRAVDRLAESDLLRSDPLRADWLVLGPLYLREEGRYRALVHEALEDTRTGAALGALGHLLFHVALDDAAGDRWSSAESEYHESIGLARESGQSTDVALALAGLAWLEARMGREDGCRAHAAEALALGDEHGIVIARVWALLALGELELGGGRADQALEHLGQVRRELSTTGLQDMDLHPGVDLVEALVRVGQREEARVLAVDYHRLSAVKGQPWALARAERALGMTAAPGEADTHFAAAARLHAETPDVFETARTALLHGASLRRRRRRREARIHLREALAAFEQLGAAQRAEQAVQELAATGETVQRRGAGVLTTLTPQERQIAELLAQGRTTRQAAAALFLSPKTVEYHLRHVYDKLGVNSRDALASVVSGPAH
jgi:DNA-binding CsgD family transcriptional regulator